MSSNFVLYVGSDLIIRALSERYLRPEDRMVWNLFALLKAAGSELVLSENTLEEVHSHLTKADREFRRSYVAIESKLTLELVRHIDEIMIRAYFYAVLDPDSSKDRPKGWKSFLGQFVAYDELHRMGGIWSLRGTLCEEFGFAYEDSPEMHSGVDPAELEELIGLIREAREHRGKLRDNEEKLAKNDALHACQNCLSV